MQVPWSHDPILWSYTLIWGDYWTIKSTVPSGRLSTDGMDRCHMLLEAADLHFSRFHYKNNHKISDKGTKPATNASTDTIGLFSKLSTMDFAARIKLWITALPYSRCRFIEIAGNTGAWWLRVIDVFKNWTGIHTCYEHALSILFIVYSPVCSYLNSKSKYLYTQPLLF